MITKKFDLNGKVLEISVKEAHTRPGWVESQKFRTQLSTKGSSFTADPVVLSPSEMFFDEVEFLIEECKNKPLETETMYDAVAELCSNHIQQCGRIIDNDLESYLDRILTLIDAIVKAGKNELTNEGAAGIRNEFRSHLLQSFFSYIYVTKRDHTGKATIAKLSDEKTK